MANLFYLPFTINSREDYGDRAYQKLGVSVVSCFWEADTFEEEFCFSLDPVFCQKQDIDINKTLVMFKDMIAKSQNIITFDADFAEPLLKAQGIKIKTTFDFLPHVRQSAFGSPRWVDTPKGSIYSLDALIKANVNSRFFVTPVEFQWQDGETLHAMNTALSYVKRFRKLYYRYINGELKDPNNHRYLFPVNNLAIA